MQHRFEEQAEMFHRKPGGELKRFNLARVTWRKIFDESFPRRFDPLSLEHLTLLKRHKPRHAFLKLVVEINPSFPRKQGTMKKQQKN
ncbi:MAG TPA: hypothetical protein VFF11_09710 [Candidatus Binatia bacterium]|nr:hypothetical protein [Candidatus Binatia bacterium]